MKFHHTFRVAAPVEAVADFHRSADSLRAITPPPIIMNVHYAPPVLADGDEMAFTMWMGPLPIRWQARIEALPEGDGFIDRQLKGPFKSWVHRHGFVAVDAEATEVVDDIEAELSDNWFFKLVGAGMWIGLPLLFAYRGWRTRQIVQR